MLHAAEEAGVQFAVGQAVRFWPEYVKAKELYDSGALGTVKYARASRLSVHPAWSEWYRRPENSGGGLFDLHLHDIDYLCYIFGKVKQVYACLLYTSPPLIEPLLRELRVKTPSVWTEAVYLSGGNQQKVVLAKWLYAEQMCIRDRH